MGFNYFVSWNKYGAVLSTSLRGQFQAQVVPRFNEKISVAAAEISLKLVGD